MLKNGIKSLKHLLEVSHSNPSSRMEFLLLERIWSRWSEAQVCIGSELLQERVNGEGGVAYIPQPKKSRWPV